MSGSETPPAPGPGLSPTRTLATAFDEETEVVRRGAPAEDVSDEQTLVARMIPESEPAPAATPAPTALLPAASAARRRALLWLAGIGAAIGFAAALAARGL